MVCPAFFSILLFLWCLFGVRAGRTPLEEEMVEACNSLGQRMRLSLRHKPNVVFSPLSLHTSLSLAKLAARGRTLSELDYLLQIYSTDKESDRIHYFYLQYLRELVSEQKENRNVGFANVLSVGPRVSIDPSFIEQATNTYQALITSRNSSSPGAAENLINDYVANRTDGKIRETISRGSINYNSSLVLASALEFNGFWEDKFDPSRTQKQDFKKRDGTTIQVDMMSDIRVVLHKRDDYYNVDIIQLPLAGERFALLLFISTDKDGIEWLEGNVFDFKSLISNMTAKRIEMSIPKFKIESRMDMESDLKNVWRGFYPANDMLEADFSGISEFGEWEITDVREEPRGLPPLQTANNKEGKDNPYISNVFQSAVFEMNESGILTDSSLDLQKTRDLTKSDNSDTTPVQKRLVADKHFTFVLLEIKSSMIFLQGKYSGY